jgi:hypothetical protein
MQTPVMSVDNLHVTCDQLNGLNFPNLEVDPMDAGHVIAALTRQLTRVTSDAALLLKWCQITVAIMRKHEVCTVIHEPVDRSRINIGDRPILRPLISYS